MLKTKLNGDQMIMIVDRKLSLDEIHVQCKIKFIFKRQVTVN